MLSFKQYLSEALASAPNSPLRELGVQAGQYTIDPRTQVYSVFTDLTILNTMKQRKDFKTLGAMGYVIDYVRGNFNCSHCGLESLVGGPKRVDGFYHVGSCNITSLEGVASEIGGDLILTENLISDLSNTHKHLKTVIGNIYLLRNPIKGGILSLLMIQRLVGRVIYDATGIPSYSKQQAARTSAAFDILNKYIGKGKQGIIDAQTEMIEADLEEFAQV